MTKYGRPYALDEARRHEVLSILSLGCTFAVAAQRVGCAVSTIHRTIERDPTFAAAVAHARSEAELAHMQNLRKAGATERYWRASAWALERLDPNTYHPGHARSITAEQLALVLTQLARAIVAQLPERYRKDILKTVEAAVRRAGRAVAKTTKDEGETKGGLNRGIE
jgi:hypothetical protein